MSLIEQLDHLIDAELESLIEIRHDLHAHPQLAFEETHANGVVRNELSRCGIDHESGIAKTGVVGWLDGEATDDAVGLRADMDALPIPEQTGAVYCSTNPGLMHACGHDGHTTILIGAARVLSRVARGGGLPRPVKFVFQPAEEQEGGAEKMVAEGVLGTRFGDVETRRMFGLHGWPGLKVGMIATKPGALLASADMFELVIRGRGGHGAMPHTTADPIVATAQVVNALQTVVSRNLDPTEPGVVTIGTVHAGTIENVIPSQAVLTGTTRAVSDETRSFLHRRVEEIAQQVASAHGCQSDFTLRLGYPVTMNDSAATDYVLKTARDMVGDRAVIEADRPAMGAEDFSYYSQQVPSCFYLIGLCPHDQESSPNLHTSRFDFNDDAIKTGVGMMCRLALGAAS